MSERETIHLAADISFIHTHYLWRMPIGDKLEMLHYETGANGGFILGRGFHAMNNIREFVDLVVPELQRRGLSKKKYEGTTLRANLND